MFSVMGVFGSWKNKIIPNNYKKLSIFVKTIALDCQEGDYQEEVDAIVFHY